MDSGLIAIPAAGQSLYEKSVGDMIEPGMYVRGDGSVFGTFKYVTGYTGFNSSVSEEQEGYFFPFDLNKSGTKMTFIKNGKPGKKGINYEKSNVFRVTKNDTFEVLVDGKRVAVFNFRNARFEKE